MLDSRLVSDVNGYMWVYYFYRSSDEGRLFWSQLPGGFRFFLIYPITDYGPYQFMVRVPISGWSVRQALSKEKQAPIEPLGIRLR